MNKFKDNFKTGKYSEKFDQYLLNVKTIRYCDTVIWYMHIHMTAIPYEIKLR